MPSTVALFTAMSGLNANTRSIDVIGNNIANSGTIGFKSSRMLFSNMYSRTISAGTAPGETSGGTNPFQVGLGTRTAGTQRNTASGTITTTGDARDLAVDGNGYFVVRRGEDTLYTRAGAFRNNALNQLITPTGEVLQGYGVNDAFNIVPGRLGDISIPLGAMTIAEPTRNVRFSGNLDADGPMPGVGSSIALTGTASLGFVAVSGASPAPGAGNRVEGTTRLVDVEDPSLPGSGTALFAAGQSIRITGAEKGSRTVPDATLDITSATTLGDLLTFLEGALGIETTVGPNPDGATPGVSLDPATGAITITGNTGTVNDLTIDQADLRLLDASGGLVRYPMTIAKGASADGESVRTTFIAYDSLGAPVSLDLTWVLDSRGNTGTTWRWYAESADATGVATQVGTGTFSFDTSGQPLTTTPASVSVDRSGTGADSPMVINFEFGGSDSAGVTALADTRSAIAATFRDGSPRGTLVAFGVGADGIVTGAFTNGLTRTLGQVALATFANDAGLEDVGGNLFRTAPNSGEAVMAPPGTLAAGRLVGGALEQSNVDLSEEFIKLVLSSTGFSANARVIRTTDELMQQLLVVGR